MTTVKENKEKYNTRDVGKPTSARKLQNVIEGLARDLVISVRSHIENGLVTTLDKKLAEKIYGTNIAGVQGKTSRRNEPAYEVEHITIGVTSKYRMVTLAADKLYVNTIQFIVSISKSIGFGKTQLIGNGKVGTLDNSLETVVNLYQVRGFQVTLALMDNQFRPLEGHMPVGVQINIMSADEHVGIIERYICTMKEKSQCVVSVLPFMFLPRALSRGIVESQNV